MTILKYLRIEEYLKYQGNMSTFSRLIRFDQDKLATIYSSGSVDYTVGDFNLSSINRIYIRILETKFLV